MPAHSMAAADWDDGVSQQTLEVVGHAVPLVVAQRPTKFLTARVLPYEPDTYFVVPGTPGGRLMSNDRS